MTINDTIPDISPAAIERECEDAPRQTSEDDVAGFLETKTAVIAASVAGGAALGGVIGAGVVVAAAGLGLAINAATSSRPSGHKVAPGT